jgi:methionine synthase I (cobalamin-dependent)
VLLDGGVGSEIVRRGVRWRWHGLRTDAEAVKKIHQDYVAAGADVISTDTFQLTRRIYLNLFHNLEHMRRIGAPGLERRAEELTRLAVSLAREAAAGAGGGRRVAVAGVVGPLGHPFRPDLAPSAEEARREHAETVRLLSECGCDLILFECMNTVAEAEGAVEAARDVRRDLPVWVSFVCEPGGRILSGEGLAEAARALEPLAPEALLVNCAPAAEVEEAVAALAGSTRRPVGAYAHVGRFDPPSWKFEFHPRFVKTEEWPPVRYAEAARAWTRKGARIVGGCCGTTPDHVRAMSEVRT